MVAAQSTGYALGEGFRIAAPLAQTAAELAARAALESAMMAAGAAAAAGSAAAAAHAEWGAARRAKRQQGAGQQAPEWLKRLKRRLRLRAIDPDSTWWVPGGRAEDGCTVLGGVW